MPRASAPRRFFCRKTERKNDKGAAKSEKKLALGGVFCYNKQVIKTIAKGTEADMDGMDMTEKFIEANGRNRFIVHNGIEVEKVERDRALLRLDIRDESRNIYGLVHGGAIYAMADNAAGCAASTDGRSYVTQAGGMRFIRNQADGRVFAEARVSHRGRSITLVAVEVRGEGDKKLAEGEFTFFCVDPDVMAAKGGAPGAELRRAGDGE